MIGTYSMVRGSTLIPVVDDHPLGEKKPLVGRKTPGR
jgi:hypothetical protein